jgi:6-phosphogluconolactonase
MSGPNCFELVRFDTAETLAKEVARRWISDPARSRPNGRETVALSGGRIARVFFQEVVAQAKSADFASTEFFWGDERCVPPTDPESNFKLAREFLLAPLNVSSNRIHRVRGEADPKLAAAEAAADLQRLLPLNADGVPVFDRVFLGMGEDGHTASLFPGQADQFIATPEFYCAVKGPKPPPWRVTLTFPVLAAARQVWVLASGTGKEDALRDSLSHPPRTPLGRLLALRQQTLIFTDINTAV